MTFKRSLPSSWKHLQVFLQKISLASHLFLKNELFNHAGAAAFYFLLSIPPVFLLLLIAFDHYLAAYPNASALFFDFIKSVNANFDRNFLHRIGLFNVKTAAFGLFGLFNLIWAGRAILTAIQRGLGIIFPADKIRPPLVMNILSFMILSVLLAASILITLVSVGFHFVQDLLTRYEMFQSVVLGLILVIRRLLPFGLLVLLVFLAYRFVPAKRPKTDSSLVSAIGCSLAIFILHSLFARFFSVTHYSVIYGVLGSLILMVVWVYFSFVLFFFFGEFTYVSDKIDVLVFERMYSFRLKKDVRGKKIEKFLFQHPKRIFEKYARPFKAGEILFREGETGTDIFFVDQGSIDIYRDIGGSNHKIATIAQGRVFGEMAYLLNEKRTATAIAQTDALILVILPEIFEDLLQVNPPFARDVIQVLCGRLRKAQLTADPPPLTSSL